MRFQPSVEQRNFAFALNDLLVSQDTPAVARAWAAGDAGPGRALWRKLADQGVHGLVIRPEHGGLGASAVDLVLAFEQLGRAAVPGPYVESVAVLPRLLEQLSSPSDLEGIALGQTVATLALPPDVPYAANANDADLVYCVSDHQLWAATTTDQLASVDGTRRLSVVQPATPLAAVDSESAYNYGALANAAYMLGLGRTLLDRAVEYAKIRRQFGASIGSFQAVKHALADVAVSVEFARPLLFAAALAIEGPDAERDVSAAALACVLAANRAAGTALQVHGAIGYTAEYDLSIWLTKVRALNAAWGTARSHRDRVRQALSREVAHV